MSEHPRTRVVRVDPISPDSTAMAEAGALLAAGGLVAFPTETVYGLGANALDTGAIDRLFHAKGRPATDPVIVHLASAGELPTVARDVPATALRLAAAFWPGPLTLVLERQPHIADALTAGLSTVGVRVPSHPVAHALLRAANVPVAAPSANSFGRPSPTRAQHVLEDLEGAIDLVIDAGATTIGVESTVLDLSVSPPLVRRPGGVTLEALRRVLPDVEIGSSVGTVSAPQIAPGQLPRHYAPRAPLTLYVGEAAAVAARVCADVRTLTARGLRVGILAPEDDLMMMAPTLAAVASSGRVRTASFGKRTDPSRAAHELFAALRRLDAEQVDEILATAPEERDLGLAIRDRLTRAAEGRVRRA